MKDTIRYKNFIGSIHFSADDDIFYGKIEGTGDTVTFDGQSVNGLKTAFHEAVDDYLALCREVGKEPLKSAKGSFNVRIPPQLHRQALGQAAREGVSLNRLVRRAIENMVGS